MKPRPHIHVIALILATLLPILILWACTPAVTKTISSNIPPAPNAPSKEEIEILTSDIKWFDERYGGYEGCQNYDVCGEARECSESYIMRCYAVPKLKQLTEKEVISIVNAVAKLDMAKEDRMRRAVIGFYEDIRREKNEQFSKELKDFLYAQDTLLRLKKVCSIVSFLPTDLPYYRSIALSYALFSSACLEAMPASMQDDRQIVMAALDTQKAHPDGSYVRYASARLRNDKEIMLLALRSSRLAISYVPDRLKADRDFISSAIKISGGYVLRQASPDLQADPALVEMAKKRDEKN